MPLALAPAACLGSRIFAFAFLGMQSTWTYATCSHSPFQHAAPHTQPCLPACQTHHSKLTRTVTLAGVATSARPGCLLGALGVATLRVMLTSHQRHPPSPRAACGCADDSFTSDLIAISLPVSGPKYVAQSAAQARECQALGNAARPACRSAHNQCCFACAEYVTFGQAEGGLNDVQQLDGMLRALQVPCSVRTHLLVNAQSCALG